LDKIVNNELMHFAHRLADRAGEVILPHFRQRGEVIDKGREAFDPVTEADRGAEAAMREMIAAEYPDHGVLGEEFEDTDGSSPYRWVLDPIDGTKAFICGMPVWGTLIGLTYEGRPVLGIMDQPHIGERFWGSGGKAHFRDSRGDRLLRTRRCGALSQAILGATTPDMFKGDETARFARLSKACRLTRFGGDCYFYCLLAMGFVDIVAEASLKPFDIVPLVPIIEGAGGVVSGWDGASPAAGGRVVAVGDPSLHDTALRALAD
jgi:myo-inositol-1(or 4)-monophosphatase